MRRAVALVCVVSLFVVGCNFRVLPASSPGPSKSYSSQSNTIKTSKETGRVVAYVLAFGLLAGGMALSTVNYIRDDESTEYGINWAHFGIGVGLISAALGGTYLVLLLNGEPDDPPPAPASYEPQPYAPAPGTPAPPYGPGYPPGAPAGYPTGPAPAPSAPAQPAPAQPAPAQPAPAQPAPAQPAPAQPAPAQPAPAPPAPAQPAPAQPAPAPPAPAQPAPTT